MLVEGSFEDKKKSPITKVMSKRNSTSSREDRVEVKKVSAGKGEKKFRLFAAFSLSDVSTDIKHDRAKQTKKKKRKEKKTKYQSIICLQML